MLIWLVCPCIIVKSTKILFVWNTTAEMEHNIELHEP